MDTNIEPVDSAPGYMRGFFSRYDYEAARQAAIERADELEAAYINRATTAIRLMSGGGQLSAKAVRQLLATLACEMRTSGFGEKDIELIDTASEVVA